MIVIIFILVFFLLTINYLIHRLGLHSFFTNILLSLIFLTLVFLGVPLDQKQYLFDYFSLDLKLPQNLEESLSFDRVETAIERLEKNQAKLLETFQIFDRLEKNLEKIAENTTNSLHQNKLIANSHFDVLDSTEKTLNKLKTSLEIHIKSLEKQNRDLNIQQIEMFKHILSHLSEFKKVEEQLKALEDLHKSSQILVSENLNNLNTRFKEGHSLMKEEVELLKSLEEFSQRQIQYVKNIESHLIHLENFSEYFRQKTNNSLEELNKIQQNMESLKKEKEPLTKISKGKHPLFSFFDSRE